MKERWQERRQEREQNPDGFPETAARRAYTQRRKKVKKGLLTATAIGVFLALCLLWLFLIIPLQAGNAVAGSFEEGLGADSARATVKGSPFALLAGEAKSLSLHLRFEEGAAVPVNEIYAEWTDAEGLLPAIREGRGGESEYSPDRLRIIWDTTTFAHFIAQSIGVIEDPVVTIQMGEMQIAGSLELQGKNRELLIQGLPQVSSPGLLTFSIGAIGIEGEALAPEIQERINSLLQIPLSIPLLDWQIGAGSIRIEDESVIFESE